MRVVALVSGGKDSCYSMLMCQQHGHEVVALANLLPVDNETDELDSYMYQTVGHQVIAAYAQCTGLPLYRRRITGTSASKDLAYSCTPGDEVEDLLLLLAFVQRHHPDVQAVASGAIASDYQRLRVESVCQRLGLVSLAFLWHQPQDRLLSEMISSDIEAVLVKVAAIGLDPHKHLGRSLRQMQRHLRSLRDRFGCNVCGEGGEYETLTLDCPAFTRGRIVLDGWEVLMHSPDSIAPVGVLHPTRFHVEPKAAPVVAQDQGQQAALPEAQVREVPVDWRPDNAPAAAADGGGGSGGGGAQEWRTRVRASASPAHVHVQCAASAAAGAGGGSAAETAAALSAALSAVSAALPALGVSWQRSCFVHLYLANMAHFATANEAYCQHLPRLNPPSRACVQVPLPPGCPVLLDVLFARPPAGAVAPPPHPGAAGADEGGQGEQPARRVLHVQSISSWAPSCIGPYSQATACRGLVHMAGQIPLDPASMAVVAAPTGQQAATAHDVTAQAWRTLRSCQAVAVALHSCFCRASLALTVYLTTGCAAAGGEAVVRAALEAAWVRPGLLDCADAPPCVSQAAAAALGGGTDEPPAGGEEGGSRGGADSGSARGDADSSSGCESEGEGAPGVVDDYLRPPEVASPVQPAVVFVTVPALPRGALLEVQPLLLDLAAAGPQSSSSSSSGGEEEGGGAPDAAGGLHAPGPAPGSPLPPPPEDGLHGVSVHVTQAAGCRSTWRRVLVHLRQQHQQQQQASAAGACLAAAVAQQPGCAIASLRCWHAAGGAGGAGAAAAAELLAAAVERSCLLAEAGGAQARWHPAVQLVPVEAVGSWTAAGERSGSGECWAVLEALLEAPQTGY